MKHKFIFVIISIAFLTTLSVNAQNESLVLDLKQTVKLANDSSLMAFRAQNMYMASYWEHRAFKARRLPSLMLNTNPIRYNRDFTRRYDSGNNMDIYRQQQSLNSQIGLSIRQNLDITGGTFFIDSDLGYMHNFGDRTFSQFSSTPIRIGYRQDLIGYNQFKWEKKIEPLKFEKAKKSLITQMEETSENATRYFFGLAISQAEYDLAKEKVEKSEMLYKMGEQRFEIAAIDKAQLLTLQLDMVNDRNSYLNAQSNLKRSMSALASFLNIDKSTQIVVKLPDYPKDILITIERALEYAKANNPSFLEMKERILRSEQNYDKTKKESIFQASITASVGYNQIAEDFRNVYTSPSQQNIVSIGLSIPLIDWGVRKGNRNMARNNLNITLLTTKQDEVRIEEDLVMTVNDFSMRQAMILSAEEALKLSKMAQEQTQERFVIGKVDVNSLLMANNRRQSAEQNYLTALRNYWQSYFKIRKLTLFDFEENQPIQVDFNEEVGISFNR